MRGKCDDEGFGFGGMLVVVWDHKLGSPWEDKVYRRWGEGCVRGVWEVVEDECIGFVCGPEGW